MEVMTVMIIFLFTFGAWLYAAWLDHKHGWRLVDWMNGRCSNPFTLKARSREQLAAKDKQLQALTERIQVLEKIVTEPAYELNKKINQL